MDVVICASSHDARRGMLSLSLAACLRHLVPAVGVYVVCESRTAVEQALTEDMTDLDGSRIVVLEDRDVLSTKEAARPGWLRQQIIKLHADRVASTDLIACLGADVVIRREITNDVLLENGWPVTYSNRYPFQNPHLDYERERLGHVAALLRADPAKTATYADFVMDLKVFERPVLVALRDHLVGLYGADVWRSALPDGTDSPANRSRFGEWTLYTVFLHDVLALPRPIRTTVNDFVAQLHSMRKAHLLSPDCYAIHFVPKDMEVREVQSVLAALDARAASSATGA